MIDQALILNKQVKSIQYIVVSRYITKNKEGGEEVIQIISYIVKATLISSRK